MPAYIFPPCWFFVSPSKGVNLRFDSFVDFGGTVSYYQDTLRFHRWRRGCRFSGLSFSVFGVPVLRALFKFKTQRSCYSTQRCCMLFMYWLIYYLFIYLLPYVLALYQCYIRFTYCTLIMYMMLSATSTHFKWELTSYCLKCSYSYSNS